MRLIDAHMLERAIMRMPDDKIDDESCCNVIAELDKAHTVDAVPVKHGRWEEQTVIYKDEEPYDAEMQSAKCSLCEKYLTTPFLYYFNEYAYCPNCGAKMDEEDDSE